MSTSYFNVFVPGMRGPPYSSYSSFYSSLISVGYSHQRESPRSAHLSSP